METFRTEVTPERFPFSIGYSDSLFFAGSCFAVEMASRMSRAGFSVWVNPYGIIFDPLSLARMLEEVIQGYEYTREDLYCFAGQWHSLRHHGSFRSDRPEALLERINKEIGSAREFLKKAGALFVTFGTAEAYFHLESGVHAANCHKLPQTQFREVLLGHTEIEQTWAPLLPALKRFNPDLKLVVTVSPVRYLRLGAVRNQISKSHLLLAAHQLCSEYPGVSYFPSYEIVMDDLRDYRFYASDRSHPTEEASEYVWTRLMEAVAEEPVISTAHLVRKDLRILDHRTLNKEDFSVQAERCAQKAMEKLRSAGHPDPEMVKRLFH